MSHAIPLSKAQRRLRLPWAVLCVLTLLIAAIGGIAIAAYRQQAAHIREAALEKIVAINKLKVNDISAWLDERRSNAVSVANIPLLVETVVKSNGGESLVEQDRLSRTLEGIRRAYRFTELSVFDLSGRLVLGAPNWAPSESVAAATAHALQTHELAFVDLHRNPGDVLVRLGYVALSISNFMPMNSEILIITSRSSLILPIAGRPKKGFARRRPSSPVPMKVSS
jgi:hypothetical protein